MLLALGAAPAAAIEDPTRPDGRVTHGPSCKPGGLVVEIVAGTTPYFVRLATTRQAAGEDEAIVQPGDTVTLRTGDVAWGETIDGRLEYEARDGSGDTFVDELDTYSFTRPTQEDCEAVAAPADVTESPAPPSAGVASPYATEQNPSPSSAGQPSAGVGEPGPSVSAAPADRTSSTAPRPLAAGGTVTLIGAGFLPGERVTIQLHGSDTVLGSGTAGDDGTVQIEVRIPSGIDTGSATVDMFGHRSESVADVELRFAALGSAAGDSGMSDLIPLVTAAVALVAVTAGLVSVAGRQRALGRGLPLRRA